MRRTLAQKRLHALAVVGAVAKLLLQIALQIELKSQRLAVVIDQTPGKLTQPQVRVFFSLKSNMPIDLQTLDLSTGSDAIVGREDPDTWGFKHLTELWSQPR